MAELLRQLETSKSQIDEARQYIDEAIAIRDEIEIEALSPKTRPLLEKIDPYLPLLGDGLAAMMSLPEALGGETYGPQTYLVLIQNEDEIRATGGFITAAAMVSVHNGEIISFSVKDSYAVDDLTRPYALSPWQMDKYLGEDTLTFRNSNWSPDFPTSAMWAEHLNAYTSAQLVDGVIAIDQEAIRILLSAIEPLNVEGIEEPITSENVHSWLRTMKDINRQQLGWRERKAFIAPLAEAMMAQILDAPDVSSMESVAKALVTALEERHVLVHMDDAELAALIASLGWDGAVRPKNGDYLMVVDSNVGWNKVNAVVQSEITYLVDLTDLDAPQSTVTLRYINPTKGTDDCLHGHYFDPDSTYQDYIERCYWNYLRVYTRKEAKLVDAKVYFTPTKWFYRGEYILPSVDILDNSGVYDENPEGLQGYGSLLVLPLDQDRQTRFEFALPEEIVIRSTGDELYRYQLYIQKQPGTVAHPVRVEVNLPAGAILETAKPNGQVDGERWSADLNLRKDLEIILTWQVIDE